MNYTFFAAPNSDGWVQDFASVLNTHFATSGVPFTTSALLDFTVQQMIAGANANPRPDFLDEDLQHLTIDAAGSRPNQLLALALTPSGIGAYQAVVSRRKAAAVTAYLQHVQANRAAITAVYGAVKMAELDQLITTLSGLAGMTVQQVEAAVEALLGVESPLLRAVDALLGLRTREDKLQNRAAPELAALLNDDAVPVELRQMLAAQLVDALVKSCTRSPNARTQRANQTRLAAIAKTLDPSAKLGAIAPGTAAFSTQADAIKQHLTQLAENRGVLNAQLGSALLTARAANVFTPALTQFAAHVKALVGVADLEVAARLAFDQDTVTYTLIAEAMATVRQLLERIRLHVADGGAVIFADLAIYVPDDLNEYQLAMNRYKVPMIPDRTNLTCWTYFNSLDAPLLEISARGLLLFNHAPVFYAVDQAKPPQLRKGTATLDLSTGARNSGQILNNDAIKGLLAPRRNFSFSRRRTYLPLYGFAGGSADFTAHCLWQKSTGGGHGIGRADGIFDEDYLWSVNPDWVAGQTNHDPSKFDSFVAEIGAFLDLKPDRLVDFRQNPLEELRAAAGGYHYAFYRKEIGGKQDDEYYVLCNMPRVGGTIPLYYLRKVAFGGSDLLSHKVIKDIHQAKNRPYPSDVDALFTDGAAEYGITLPISFSLDANRTIFNARKRDLAVIKNRGNALMVNPRFRKNAGVVMAAIRPFCPPQLRGSAAYLSSAELSQTVVPVTPAVEAFQQLRRTSSKQIATDQEWCHLRGHGDGGEERVGNFVAGSNHCNTEQLAIESAQRAVTQSGRASYALFTTAYLLPDRSMALVSGAPYLGTDGTYRQKAYGDKAAGDQKIINDLALTAHNAPVAAYIRYRVYWVDGQQRHKMFEHLFEGQSEFFDKNQYNILHFAVRWSLDKAAVVAEIAEYVAELKRQPRPTV